MEHRLYWKLVLVVGLALVFCLVSLALLKPGQVSARYRVALEARPTLFPESGPAVLAQNNCTPIRPGDLVTDTDDLLPDRFDFLLATSTISGEVLMATMYFEDLPISTTDDAGALWEVYLDTDDDLLTGFEADDGRQGADYSITVRQVVDSQPFPGSLTVEVWHYGRTDWDVINGTSSLSVDTDLDVMNVTALITTSRSLPGVSSNTRIVFFSESLSDTDIIDCANPDGIFEGGLPDNGTTTISNTYLKVDVESGGKFVIGTTGGNPDITGDEDKRLMYGFEANDVSYAGTSFLSLWVGGNASSLAGLAPDFGPSSDSQRVVTAWLSDSVRITQTLSFMENPFSGRADMVKMEYQVTNEDSVSRQIGLRYLLDTMIGNNDDAPFFIPELGNTNTEHTIPFNEIITFDDNSSTGITIPLPIHFSVFEADNFDNESLKALGLLDPFFIDTDSSTLVPPDRFLIANWSDLFDSTWDFITLPDYPHGDSAIAIYWGYETPITLAAGESTKFTMGYGLPETDVGVIDTDADWLIAPDALAMSEEITITYVVYNNTNNDIFYNECEPTTIELESSFDLLVLNPAADPDYCEHQIRSHRSRRVSSSSSAIRRSRVSRRPIRLSAAQINVPINYTLTYRFANGLVFTETKSIQVDSGPQPGIFPVYLPLVFGGN